MPAVTEAAARRAPPTRRCARARRAAVDGSADTPARVRRPPQGKSSSIGLLGEPAIAELVAQRLQTRNEGCDILPRPLHGLTRHSQRIGVHWLFAHAFPQRGRARNRMPAAQASGDHFHFGLDLGTVSSKAENCNRRISSFDPRVDPNVERLLWIRVDKRSPGSSISSNMNTPADAYGHPQLSSKYITAPHLQLLPQVHLAQGTVGQSMASAKLCQ
jgi:hypothetical protein